MGRNATTAPRTFTTDWPNEPCGESDAEAIRLLALALSEHVGRGRAWSARSAAAAAGIDHGMVVRLIAGESWPEARTVVRLERGLGVRLWPDHLAPRPDANDEAQGSVGPDRSP